MPTNPTCYQILIASPGDVQAERQIVVECIQDWNSSNSSRNVILQPRRWEIDMYPEMGKEPQGIINQQIVNSADMVVAVFWHRIGSPTATAVRGR